MRFDRSRACLLLIPLVRASTIQFGLLLVCISLLYEGALLAPHSTRTAHLFPRPLFLRLPYRHYTFPYMNVASFHPSPPHPPAPHVPRILPFVVDRLPKSVHARVWATVSHSNRDRRRPACNDAVTQCRTTGVAKYRIPV